MKDDSQRMPIALDDVADAVPQLYPIVTPRAVHRSTMDREHDGIALAGLIRAGELHPVNWWRRSSSASRR